MKRNFNGQIKRTQDDKKDLDAIYEHTQRLTDSLISVIEKGLTFSDNLPIDLLTVQVKTGIPTRVNSQRFTVKGAIPVVCRSTIKQITVNLLQKGGIDVTLDLSDTQTDVTFLLVGEF